MLRLLVSFALCWSCEANSKDSKACKPQEHVLLQHGKASLNRGANTGKKVGLRRNNSNLELPDTIFFDAVLRDFKADHPDFESMDGHTEGLVESTLGADKKPVYKGGPQLSNKSNFDQWFNDVPGVNRRVDFKMDLQKTEEGTYVHDNATFFPVDDKGWQDTAIALDGLAHNFYFTLELHTTFVYKSGDEFTFRGDDDVWVFMNDQLVIDLGGVHNPMEKTFQVDSLNVSQGSAVTLSFFFAERRCCGSEFRLETSIVPVKGACTIWGDPHINTFDSGLFGAENAVPVSILTSGDYWLVKNQDIKIQGRYGTTQFTVDGQSALLELAISGPFINNDTIVIQPMSGAVTWNKQQILSSIPSEFARPYARLRFTEGEKHIDSVLSGYPVKLLRGFMVRNVELIVNRWPEHIDAIIKMPQQLNGQDGHCGNFNFDPSDDTKEQILERADVESDDEEEHFPSFSGEKSFVAQKGVENADGKESTDETAEEKEEEWQEVTAKKKQQKPLSQLAAPQEAPSSRTGREGGQRAARRGDNRRRKDKDGNDGKDGKDSKDGKDGKEKKEPRRRGGADRGQGNGGVRPRRGDGENNERKDNHPQRSSEKKEAPKEIAWRKKSTEEADKPKEVKEPEKANNEAESKTEEEAGRERVRDHGRNRRSKEEQQDSQPKQPRQNSGRNDGNRRGGGGRGERGGRRSGNGGGGGGNGGNSGTGNRNRGPTAEDWFASRMQAVA